MRSQTCIYLNFGVWQHVYFITLRLQ